MRERPWFFILGPVPIIMHTLNVEHLAIGILPWLLWLLFLLQSVARRGREPSLKRRGHRLYNRLLLLVIDLPRTLREYRQ